MKGKSTFQIVYDGLKFDQALRLDLLGEDIIIGELLRRNPYGKSSGGNESWVKSTNLESSQINRKTSGISY